MKDEPAQPLGARPLADGRCSFVVWAPFASRVDLLLQTPVKRVLPMRRADCGYYQVTAERVGPGDRYLYLLNGDLRRPDPASRFQPRGVHEASEIAGNDFDWRDPSWFGIPLKDYILYEMHVGTFTQEGTFDAAIPHLRQLTELGITAVELMPVAQFPGSRNWGYDGVYPFAVQDSYGGPPGLKRLVDACHQAGLAVVLDVVYNHMGPEGNYLSDFGPYFTDRYHTAWGKGFNFDGEDSDQVRRFFIENALWWQTEFHLDALRLDAVHAICDFSASPFLEELARATRVRAEELNRRFYLIAESDLNDPRLITPAELGGFGLDAQWSDDFHHALHVLVTGETDGYYADFAGDAGIMAKVLREGYAYTGQYSGFRRRRHGRSPSRNCPKQFVVCSQNHDQVGNRVKGDRLSTSNDLEKLKVAAGAVLLSPFLPLLFMGEEYGEPAPFRYFISHTDPKLVEAVRQGRREEFSAFEWTAAPDPQAESNFRECVLQRRDEEPHRLVRSFYTEVIRLRKGLRPIVAAEKDSFEAQPLEARKALWLGYSGSRPVRVALCFEEEPTPVRLPLPEGSWEKLLDSAEQRWKGPGSAVPARLNSPGSVNLSLPPMSVVVLQQAGS